MAGDVQPIQGLGEESEHFMCLTILPPSFCVFEKLMSVLEGMLKIQLHY